MMDAEVVDPGANDSNKTDCRRWQSETLCLWITSANGQVHLVDDTQYQNKAKEETGCLDDGLLKLQ